MRTFHQRVEGKAPQALATAGSLELPESFRYRVKRKLLGPPLVTEQLSSERLGKASALGVLSPDCISSSAYGSEEMLRVLIPVVGVAAFSLLLPVTVAILVVLFFVTLSYLEVIQAYTKAGGSYVVARDNFGVKVAQIASVALIIDYTVTVAVQTAAGTDAVTSAAPALSSYKLPITVGVVLLLAYGNLRGIREAGRSFALPTYLFIVTLGIIIVTGVVRAAMGELSQQPIHVHGAIGIGTTGSGFLMGASVFIVLRAFANGGSSLTGLEAISNGVGAFRPPTARNARIVLVVMSTVLGGLVLGVSYLAHVTHAVPFVGGSPTVISQEAKLVMGSGAFGTGFYYLFQVATMLILYTGGNTSFNGFPYLTSFVAGDEFLPRQLTRRGHRLTFSNGIIVLTVVAVILLVVTDANVDSLVAVYAIGVFTGFTMAGAGMVKHHSRFHERGWVRRLSVNGIAAILSAAVVVIFAITKFTEGAWVVVVIFPILMWMFIRLHRQYKDEERELEEGAPEACKAPVLRRHVVLILVDRIDLATAKAIRYARTLDPDEIRAVHFAVDPLVARRLEEQWSVLQLPRLSLELIDCPDRRVGRAAMELAADAAGDSETEVTVVLPRRAYRSRWSRFLHDRTADRIAAIVGELPNVNATIVPFLFRGRVRQKRPPAPAPPRPARDAPSEPGTTPIGELRYRRHAKVAGKVRSVRVQPSPVSPNLTCRLEDSTGGLTLVFLGRRNIAGIEPGARLVAEGMVGEQGERLAMFNPDYELVASADVGAGGAEA